MVPCHQISHEQYMDLESRRKKLSFRAHHRGIRELDLYIGAFADAELEGMSEPQLDEFEGLLDIPDNTMLDWIYGRDRPDAQGGVLLALLEFEYPGR